MTVSSPDFEPREMCTRCERPARVCFCRHLPRLEASTPLLVVQHPRERHVAIGTARMASLCLPGSTLVIGTHVDDDPDVVRALSDPARPAVLLWPGPGARDLATEPPAHPVTLIVVDGTWSLAKKLVKLNPRLAALPRYALTPTIPSEYRIRREPAEGCVSTLEAIAQALGILEGKPGSFEAMRDPFRAMIDTQIEHQKRLQGGRARSFLRRRPLRPRPIDAALAEPSRLVVIAAEANAWPYEGTEKQPDELVYLTAVRLGTGELFDAFVAPELPLCPSTMDHARVSESQIRNGLSNEELRNRWRAFVRDDDVVCSWNAYALTILERRGAFIPANRFDVRVGAARWLGSRPGGIERIVSTLGLESASMGEGRAGERLGKIAAVVDAMRTPRPRRGRACVGATTEPSGAQDR